MSEELQLLLRKGPSQKFAHRGQTKELSYGALPSPQTKVWSTMGEMYSHITLVIVLRVSNKHRRSSPQPAQTMSSVSRRELSWRFNVHCEKKTKKTWRQSRVVEEENNFYFILHARKRAAIVDPLGVELEQVPIKLLQPGL